MSEEALKLSEAAWAACAQTYDMLDDLRARSAGHPDWRRMRLFGCACCRTVWHLLADERSWAAVEVAERYADGDAAAEGLADAEGGARAVAYATKKMPFKDAAWAVTCVTGRDESTWMGACSASRYAADALAKAAAKKPAERAARQAEAFARQAGLVRCIFGDPFRPFHADPAWLTPTVNKLAWAAVEGRQLPTGELDPARLAVLADALEEAGADALMVAHLRSAGPHVRGCWAVDAALGRDVNPPRTPAPPAATENENENEYAPCFGGGGDGRYWLGFTAFAGTAAVFEELGQEGGGYGWHGVVDALVRMRAPKLRKKLSYDPEASMFTVSSTDAAAIRQVCDLIRAALADPALLREAIGRADPDLMNP